MHPKSRDKVLATAYAAVLSLAAGAAGAASPPNIVFIHSDDHGWADVGYRGSVIDTPNIDSIAAAGVTLDHYHAQPICGPTRVGLMTGRNPIRMGLTANISDGEDGVPLDEHFVSQTFAAAGYQTWALGKWHLGGSTSTDYLPTSRGFDHFYGFVGGAINESTHVAPGTGNLDWQRNGTPVVESGLSTDLLATEAISLIQARDSSRPFFLYLSFHAVHTPYDSPQELQDKYAGLGLTGDQLAYSAMVENMDINIGRVLSELSAQGLTSNTIVVFASDNGADEARGGSNLPLRGWKGEIFEGANRTPAAMQWPDAIAPGSVSEQFVSHQDWLPTLARAAGVPLLAVKPLDGRDRWDEILEGDAGGPEAYVVVRGPGTSVMDGDWKLLQQTNGGPWELYDLSVDPYETTDVSGAWPAVVADLAAYAAMIENDEDDDADLVPDTSDDCTTLLHRAVPASPPDQNPASLRLTLSAMNRDPGEQKLVAKGYFNPSSDVPAVDPSVNGVRVLVMIDGDTVFDGSVPGGLTGSSPCDSSDGWSVAESGSGTKWKYRNVSGGLPDGLGGCTAGAANGLSRITIADKTASSKLAYQFKVSARRSTFATIPASVPATLQFDVSLAAQMAPGVATDQAIAGQCAEFRLDGDPIPTSAPKPYCKVSPSSGPIATIRCSGA